jgi:tetratricopeptide (TPR) repeat protein
MDETGLLALVAEGENDSVDFKRELHLESARDKAEFVKDVISLANSPQGIGYLLIGVADDKYIQGVDTLEEERIQQIAHRYIDPPVGLWCSLVRLSASTFPLVGVIEIRGRNKPHKVRRDLDRLQQDDVYVRRGSVVTKATPEEIIGMRETETGLRRESREHTQAAKKHLKLGNLREAYQAYSAAIVLTPMPELFVARAQVLEQHRSPGIHSRLEVDKLSLALKDYSDALSLGEATDPEQEIRMGRLRLCGLWDFHMEGDDSSILEYVEGTWAEDVRWLEEHAKGLQRGEFLFLKQKARWSVSCYREDGWTMEETPSELSEALQLGFKSAEVYYFMALSHYYVSNYGLTLQDVNSALEIAEDSEIMADCLRLRASVLLHKNRFSDAYHTIQRANGWAESSLGYDSFHQLADEIIYRIGIGCQFGALDKDSVGYDFKAILTILLISTTRPFILRADGKVVLRHKSEFKELFPEVASTIRSIVGEDAWRASKSEDASYSVELSFRDSD